MTFTVFLVTELNQICRLLKAATVHCPGWIIYTRIEMTSGKRWHRRDKDNSDRVKGTLDWEEKLLLVRDSNAMVVIQRLKLMMALTDSETCVCLSTFLQVQLSTPLKFFCYATHKLIMTYSRKAFRGKKKKRNTFYSSLTLFESLTSVNKCDLTCFEDNRQQNNTNPAVRQG